MDNAMIATVVAMMVIFAFCILVAVRHMLLNVCNPDGKGAGKKTARILQKYGVIRGFKTLSDVTISAGEKSVRVENLLIGYFGILMVHTLGARGEYYGTLDGECWTITWDEGRVKTTVPNPRLQLEEAAALTRARFSKNGVYNIPIETLVYICSRAKKTGVFITHSGEILFPGKLSAYLGKTKFEKDMGIDVKKLAALIQADQ